MARPLAEYFATVRSTDVADYGFGTVEDFLMPYPVPNRPQWVITNPPFNLGAQFVTRALQVATRGCAFLVRTNFLATIGRYKLFSKYPPAIVAQFAERVPMFAGRIDPDGSTATEYCWIVWNKNNTNTRFRWIPPCRKELEVVGDYTHNNENQGE